jgi:hypothetical protein
MVMALARAAGLPVAVIKLSYAIPADDMGCLDKEPCGGCTLVDCIKRAENR